ncbi:HNH endonuclease signature motif containing protein [Piscicoccus intestinalis]|uniref:HNH endonuclease signature motif containing protein n=1 Tax=Piscicoccus intestinalis TaxID=746033 RepID=UPI00083907B6|nr:HNH endonuclease signature motif containing protein [Piscicoccus intestinalis]
MSGIDSENVPSDGPEFSAQVPAQLPTQFLAQCIMESVNAARGGDGTGLLESARLAVVGTEPGPAGFPLLRLELLPGHSRPGDSLPGHSLPRDPLPGHSLPGHSLPGHSLPRDPLPGDPLLGGWERLREIEEISTSLELERAAIMERLARAQAADDLAAQNERVDRGELPERHRKPAAQLLDEARVCVVDTAVATLGGSRGPWSGRIALGLAPESVAAPVRAAIAQRAMTFDQGAALIRDLDDPEVTPDAGQKVCDAVVAYATAKAAATGAPVGQGLFHAKKRRELVKHVGAPARRARALRTRTAWVLPRDDGSADFGVSGADVRCLAAYGRVDAIARAVRAGGDPRTLNQLRSDVALDLLLFGQPGADAPTAVDHPAESGWPAAVVQVVVSAASVLGLNDEPGVVDGQPVAADTVRDLAHAAGSTWQRIVTDPLTGYAMAQVSDSYQPPPRMAAAVTMRDGICRAPGCNRPAIHVDLDHVVERRDGGHTSGDQLQGLCRLHHSKKTRRHWAARMTTDGVVEWRLPDGRTYTTYPMDYRELGLHPDEGVDRPGAPVPDAHNSAEYRTDGPDDPDETRPDIVGISVADLEAIDHAAFVYPREINRLREALAVERAANEQARAAGHVDGRGYGRVDAGDPPF